MANDVSALTTKIIRDLSRGDLSISDALIPYIQSTVLDYEETRLYFNEQQISLTISLTNTYALSLFATAGSVADIIEVDRDGVRVTVNGRNYGLKEKSWRVLANMNTGVGTMQGYPTDYSIFNQALQIFPQPNATMTLTIDAHVRFTELVNLSDSNPWTVEGRNLLRYGTCARYTGAYLRDTAAAQMFTAAEQRSLASLLRRTEAMSGTTIPGSL